MKRLTKVLAIILTTGISASAMAYGITPKNALVKHETPAPANTTVNVVISTLSASKAVKISALNETGSPVTISIYDNIGSTVYTEEITTPEINKIYNLSSLPMGTYTIYVSSDNFSTYKEIVIQ